MIVALSKEEAILIHEALTVYVNDLWKAAVMFAKQKSAESVSEMLKEIKEAETLRNEKVGYKQYEL